MTREDQIQHATAVYQAKLLGQGYNPVAADDCADGFYEGALWADSTPNWHKNDEMPEEGGLYLVLRQDIPIILYWKADELCWDDPDEDDFVCTPKGVVAWMELPQPPKFD